MKFLFIYNESRKNALYPSTLSLERHRLLWLYLKNETTLFEKKIKLLHFAPEQAFYRRFKKLSNIQKKYKKTVEIGSYPFFRLGKIGVAIVTRSTSQKKLKNVNAELMKLIKLKKIKILNL